jgi:hypothetical protein
MRVGLSDRASVQVSNEGAKGKHRMTNDVMVENREERVEKEAAPHKQKGEESAEERMAKGNSRPKVTPTRQIV